jgi:hypothetical protein
MVARQVTNLGVWLPSLRMSAKAAVKHLADDREMNMDLSWSDS